TLGVALSSGITMGLACRLLTGAALAGVYPPGMKIAAGWFKEGRGLAIGILVGALTLGSASPHLVRWAVSPAAWRVVLIVAAASEHARRAAAADVTGLAALVTFAVVGSGAIGCWLGGKYADRWGRTLVTSTVMVVSGSCASVVGLFFGAPLVALAPLLLVWGISVVADS